MEESVHSVKAALVLPAHRKGPTPFTPEEAPDTMNVFRILGDISHLLAIIILLLKILKSKSCAGECSHTPGKEGGPSWRAAQQGVQAEWVLKRLATACTSWQPSPVGSSREVILFLLLQEERAVLEGCDVARHMASG